MTETIKLTALDLLLPRTWTRWTLRFDVKATAVEAAASLLCQSFDRLLQEIPLLGGHLTDSANRTDHVDHIVVPKPPPTCFSIRNFTDNPQDFEIEKNQYPLTEYPSDVSNIQIFAAQANIVGDSITLAFCVHHMVMDGTAMSQVLRRWAEHSLAISTNTIPPPFQPKSLDRTPIYSAGIENTTITHPAYRIIPTDSPADIRPPSAQMDADTDIKMPVNVFTIDIPALSQLKQDIIAHLNGPASSHFTSSISTQTTYISTNDALTALLWHRITHARQRPDLPTPSKPSRLNLAVNVRPRLALSPTYLGTAAIFATCLQPIPHLLNDSISAFASTAHSIRTSIQSLTPATIAAIIHHISTLPSTNRILPAADFFLGNDVIINSWLEFGIYEDDWGGALGRVEKLRKTRYPSGKGYDGLNTVLPRRRDGGIEVVVSLKEEDMERLVGDELFGMYAKVGEW